LPDKWRCLPMDHKRCQPVPLNALLPSVPSGATTTTTNPSSRPWRAHTSASYRAPFRSGPSSVSTKRSFWAKPGRQEATLSPSRPQTTSTTRWVGPGTELSFWETIHIGLFSRPDRVDTGHRPVVGGATSPIRTHTQLQRDSTFWRATSSTTIRQVTFAGLD
jgi:hypothetical protein